MLEGFLHLFARRPLGQIGIDVLDLLVVSALIYRLFLLMKGTRAVQMVVGIALVLLTYGASKWLGLVTLQNIFSYLLASFVLILVVVFQNDIRRALMRIGSSAPFRGLGHAMENKVVDEVVAAVTDLARHRIGAIIAFEQDANLDEFVVGQGVTLNAAVSRELLVTLFLPESANKLHDGAVIIRNLMIARAGTFFPMLETRNIDASYGSRHRAAIGITEETDAVVVVVSEERGSISFCFNGNIVSNLDGEELRATLLRIFGHLSKKALKPGKEPARTTISAVTTLPGRVVLAAPGPARVAAVSKIPPPPKSVNPSETPKTRDITSPMPAAPPAGSPRPRGEGT